MMPSKFFRGLRLGLLMLGLFSGISARAQFMTFDASSFIQATLNWIENAMTQVNTYTSATSSVISLERFGDLAKLKKTISRTVRTAQKAMVMVEAAKRLSDGDLWAAATLVGELSSNPEHAGAARNMISEYKAARAVSDKFQREGVTLGNASSYVYEHRRLQRQNAEFKRRLERAREAERLKREAEAAVLAMEREKASRELKRNAEEAQENPEDQTAANTAVVASQLDMMLASEADKRKVDTLKAADAAAREKERREREESRLSDSVVGGVEVLKSYSKYR
ncbi:hypothetical protein OH491_23905 [Termitidicoccus mucosus]|uniref:Uncharacterized protein n=1 Tax=Termitidicoccus mucosus TaxID=1184151 RepID=A0A178IQD4_9BACT|nr:hypothetical protein AW736_02590 [Opitutaceae bacterium TSB47]